MKMKGSGDAMGFALFLVLAIVAVIIGVTALTTQAPTVAVATNTASGSALANAGITGNTLAGTVYSFYNVFWALGGLAIVGLIVFVAKKQGYL
jgi:hypothetical protein